MKYKVKNTNQIIDVISWGNDGSYVEFVNQDGTRVYSKLNYYKDLEAVDNIDWEHRRYEIAKDISCAYLQAHSNIPFDDISKVSVKFYDKLIKQLKARQNEI